MPKTPAPTCNACGLSCAAGEEFCYRVGCLTYGGGAVVAGPPMLNPLFFPKGS